MPEKSSRIGILGGTFDPLHHGHLALAQAGLREFKLDKVLFVPAAQPPHKLDDPVTPFHHRAMMLDLALAAYPAFFLDRMEERRPGASYSVDTLRELRERLGWACALYFIIGSDAFAKISTWKNFSELFRYADFLVATRPATALNASSVADYLDSPDSPGVPDYLRVPDSPNTLSAPPDSPWRLDNFLSQQQSGFQWDQSAHCWRHFLGARLYPLPVKGALPIAATAIRRRVQAGQSIEGLVPAPVKRYIEQHRLYRA